MYISRILPLSPIGKSRDFNVHQALVNSACDCVALSLQYFSSLPTKYGEPFGSPYFLTFSEICDTMINNTIFDRHKNNLLLLICF